MFQRAPPELSGFGVITSTSLVSRSSKDSMPSGLPLRVAITTTDSWPIPSYLFLSQSGATWPPSSTRAIHVAALREVDERGGLAGFDRAALVAGGAEGAGEADALALGGGLEAGLEGFLVDGLRGGVGDDVELAAASEPEPVAVSSLEPQPAARTAKRSTRSAPGEP